MILFIYLYTYIYILYPVFGSFGHILCHVRAYIYIIYSMLSWIALWCQSVSVELTFWYLPLVLFPSREIGNDIYGIYVVVRNDIDRVVRPLPGNAQLWQHCGALGRLDQQCRPEIFG